MWVLTALCLNVSFVGLSHHIKVESYLNINLSHTLFSSSFFVVLFYYFGCSMQGHSSQSGTESGSPASGVWHLNHWTARKPLCFLILD